MTPDQQAKELREALAEVARLNDPSFDDYTFVMNAGDAKVLADAARWALDLIEGGKAKLPCEHGNYDWHVTECPSPYVEGASVCDAMHSCPGGTVVAP